MAKALPPHWQVFLYPISNIERNLEHDAALDADTVRQFTHILAVDLPGLEVLADLEGEVNRQSSVDLGAHQIVERCKSQLAVGIQHGQVLRMAVVVPDHEIEKQPLHHVVTIGERNSAPVLHQVVAILERRAAIILVLHAGRFIQQLAQVGLIQALQAPIIILYPIEPFDQAGLRLGRVLHWRRRQLARMRQFHDQGFVDRGVEHFQVCALDIRLQDVRRDRGIQWKGWLAAIPEQQEQLMLGTGQRCVTVSSGYDGRGGGSGVVHERADVFPGNGQVIIRLRVLSFRENNDGSCGVATHF